MSSPDPLADILANCHAARQAIAEAQFLIETCIAEIEAICVPTVVDTTDNHTSNEAPSYTTAS